MTRPSLDSDEVGVIRSLPDRVGLPVPTFWGIAAAVLLVGHSVLAWWLRASTPDVLTTVVAAVIIFGTATQVWWTDRKMRDFRSILNDMAKTGQEEGVLAWYDEHLTQTFGRKKALRGGVYGVLIVLILSSLIGWPFIHEHLALNMYDVLGGTLMAFFAGVSQWTFHQVGKTISELPTQPVELNLHEHRSSGVFYLGKLMLTLWIWIIGLILIGEIGVATTPVPGNVHLIGHFAVVVMTLAALVWFFAVQWNIHQMMVNRKRSRLEEVTVRLDSALEQPLEAIDDEEKTVEEVRHLRWLYDEIDQLPEWPFDTKTAFQVFTGSIVPIVAALLQLLV